MADTREKQEPTMDARKKKERERGFPGIYIGRKETWTHTQKKREWHRESSADR
jgi:hypothetical protein